MAKKFFDRIADSILDESGAQVVVMYGQVTDASASVVRVWSRSEIDIDEFEDDIYEFNAPAMVKRNLHRCFITDTERDPLIKSDFAKREGLCFAALFHLEVHESIVVAFGFTNKRDPKQCSRLLYELAQRLAFLNGCREWTVGSLATISRLVSETVRTLAATPTMDLVLQKVGQLLEQALGRWNLSPNIDIWTVDHRSEPGSNDVLPILSCKCTFGYSYDNKSTKEVEFGRGIIGWVAENRLIANVLTKDEDEELPTCEPVSDYYIPFGNRDRTQAELAVPMIYQGHLVGVLNLESPVRRRFLPEHVLMAQIVAAHAAQAIHEKSLKDLYDRILGEDDLDKLSATIAQEVGKFIEAPFSSVFLWDLQRQCLRLTAASAPFVNAQGGTIKPGEMCYPKPGIGLVRWAFENKMSLMLNDIVAYNDDKKDAHRSQWENLSNQVIRQCLITSRAEKLDEQAEYRKSGDDRKLWRVTMSGGALTNPVQRRIPQPIWCKDHCHPTGPSKSIIAIPLLDVDPSLPALGVLRFSRRDKERPFTEHDVELITGISRHLGQAISRKKQQESHELEKSFISEVVTMQPVRWDEEFQRRLEKRLKNIHDVTSADAIVVWLCNNNELDYVAAYPTDDELSVKCKKDVRIPKQTYVGRGVAGRAVAQRSSLHVEEHDDACLHEICEASVDWPEAERRFVKLIKSETAVPLTFQKSIVGVITAISFDSTAHKVHQDGDSWYSREQGIHDQHTSLLNFHARWLGPALVTIQQIVRRERQMSALSIAAQKLAIILREDDPRLLTLAALVIATHFKGLRFHQAMVAKSMSPSPLGSQILVRGEGNDAWGSISFEEHDDAHRSRQDLEADLACSLENPDYGLGIQSAWTHFECRLNYLPQTPCLLVRGGADRKTLTPSSKMTRYVTSDADNGLGQLLDRFCEIYQIDPQSPAGQKMRIGIVSLGSGPKLAESSSVMFVTNVGWRMEEGKEQAYIDDFSCEAVDALQELARILGLAQATPQHRETLKNEVD